MAIKDMTAPRKEYFNRKRAKFVATWVTDSSGIVHIPLKNGFEALISENKKEVAAQFTWFLKKRKKIETKYYAEAKVLEEFREQLGRVTSLHRVVLGASNDVQVDHRNGNGLDCTDGNIRIATQSQNASNRHYKNKTGYRGVFKRSKSSRFGAQIEYHGKNRNLGMFDTAKQAARRYNEEAIKLFGEFAILNELNEYEGDLVDLLNHVPYDSMDALFS